MLKKLRSNWHNTTQKHPYATKSRSPRGWCNSPAIRGGGGAKKQNDLHICVLRRYFCQNDQLHHRERQNATEAALHANNGIFGRDNACEYFTLAIDRKYL
jgi:hypothetical protein